MKLLKDIKKVKKLSQEIKKYYPSSYLFLIPSKASVYPAESIMSIYAEPMGRQKSVPSYSGSFKAMNGGNFGYVSTKCPCCKSVFNYYKTTLGSFQEMGKVRCPTCINMDLNNLDQDYNKTLSMRKSLTTKIFNWLSRRTIKKIGLKPKK